MTDIEVCPSCKNLICTCSVKDLGDPDPVSGKCNVCNRKGFFPNYLGIPMCKACRENEIELQEKSRANAEERVIESRMTTLENQSSSTTSELDAISSIVETIPVNGSIQVREDYFNAHSESIIERKKRIDSDESIEKKHFALANELKDEFIRLRDILFSVRETEVKITSQQRNIQTYLNELANKLRKDEREKLKIADLSYQPPIVKQSKERKSPRKPKFDKAELKRVSDELGIPVFTIQTLCVAQGKTPEQVASDLKSVKEKP